MYIGVDLGGTNIVTGLVSEEGNIINSYSVATEASQGAEAIINKISNSVNKIITDSKIEKTEINSVGIGIPGIVNPSGVVLDCVNLGWENIALKDKLENILNIKVFVGNDATVAGIAEAWKGSLKGEDCAALLTLGTGVGGGLIIGGKVYSGNNGIASELGHMVVGDNFYDCNCGRNGCLETYSSATGVIKYAIKVVNEADLNNSDSKFAIDFKNNVSKITCKDVFDYAKLNDKLAKSVVDRMVKYLVRGIVNLVITIDVEKISIGGGVSSAGLYLIDLIKNELEKERIFRSVDAPRVVLATMGNEAGVVGAALIEKFTI